MNRYGVDGKGSLQAVPHSLAPQLAMPNPPHGAISPTHEHIENPHVVPAPEQKPGVTPIETVHGRQPLPPLELAMRDLRQDDVERLEWHGGENLRSWYRAQWQAHHMGSIRVLVAELNGFPIGQIAIHWHGKPSHPLVPDLQSFRIFEAFRGLGVGTVLLDCAENVVRERGYRQVSLAVGIENPRARKLYERRGYAVLGKEYEDKWHYVDARGEICHMSERVIDLIKNLRETP